jgi:hypothetical protein
MVRGQRAVMEETNDWKYTNELNIIQNIILFCFIDNYSIQITLMGI